MSEIVKMIKSLLIGDSKAARVLRFAIVIFLLLYMTLIEPYNLQVTHNTFDMFDDGSRITIVLIGDFHDAYNYPDYFQRVVDSVNAQDADIILIAGDNVNMADDAKKLKPIRNMKSKYGIYAVLGNHDYTGLSCNGAECANEVEREMENSGVRVLRNEHELMKINGNEFALVGVDDLWAGRSDYQKAVEGLPLNTTRIILTHNQLSVIEEDLEGHNLVLSGHTHCGQVRLPFITEALMRITGFASFDGGRASINEDSDLYVTCGIVPGVVRFFAPPEISVIHLN